MKNTLRLDSGQIEVVDESMDLCTKYVDDTFKKDSS